MARPCPPVRLRSRSVAPAAAPAAAPTAASVATPAVALSVALCVALGAIAPATAAPARFKPKKALPDGWDASVQLGAQATSGASRTSSLSGATRATYRGGRAELLLEAKALQSASSVVVPRRDANGEEVLGADGEPVQDLVRERTNDRRFVGLQPRWFYRGDRHYVFAIADVETNEPADIDLSTRQIGGIGYRVLGEKGNYFSAGVGVGHKRLERVSGENDEGGIGYVGLDVVRTLGERAKFQTTLDSDFGGENRFTELALTFSWKLNEPVALKLGYEARLNSDIGDPSSPFDESIDARATISLEIDVL